MSEHTLSSEPPKPSEPSGPSGLLDAVRAHFQRYIKTQSPGDLDLLALFCLHTWVAYECYTTPRLLIDSPMPGSGKTTLLEHMQRLCRGAVIMSSVSSEALLVRMVTERPRTLLIDEADRSLRPDNPIAPAIMSTINSGYKRGATRPVLEPKPKGGWRTLEMSTFAPVVMAGNGPNLPPDTLTRVIRVVLYPDYGGTVEESDWEAIETSVQDMHKQIERWADANRQTVSSTKPVMPPSVKARFREKWQPLARVAASFSGRWPSIVDALAIADVEQAAKDQEDGMVKDSPHVLAVKHLHEIWPNGHEFAPTLELVAALIAYRPDVWGAESRYGKDLTPQRLGQMMSQRFKINTTKSDDQRTRGYRRTSLAKAWELFGITGGSDGQDGLGGSLETVPAREDVRAEHSSKPCTSSDGPVHLRESSTPIADPFQEALDLRQENPAPCQQCGKLRDKASVKTGHDICTSCELENLS